jgi:hypothetical protein
MVFIAINAPVAQGIEHWFPKPCAHVRIMPGAPASLIFLIALM